MQSPKVSHLVRRRSSLLRTAVRSAGILGACLSATIILESAAQGGIITWLGTTDGNWSDVTTPRWSPSTAYPDAADATADFNTVDLTGDITVHLNVPATLNQLIFGDTATATAGGWTLDNNGSATNVLTLGGTTPTITVNALGTGKIATISANISGSAFSVAGVGGLSLTGQLLSAGAVVTKTNTGTLVGDLSISNALNNFRLVGNIADGGVIGSAIAGKTTITDGVVVLGASAAPLRIGQRTNATLILAGSVTASTPTSTDLLIGYNDSTYVSPLTNGLTGSLAMNGASNLTVNGNLKVGEARNTAGTSSQAKAVMTLNTTGTLHVTGNLYVGSVAEASGKRTAGTMTITKGTVNVDGNMQVQASGDVNSYHAIFTQNAGTMTITGNLDIKNARVTKGNTADVTIKGTTIVNGNSGVTLSGGSTGTSRTSLAVNNAGILKTKGITFSNSATDSFINLGENGATIVALGNNDSFIGGSATKSISIFTGGVIFDSNSFNIGINKALNNATSNAGKITKQGAGAMTLNVVNGYTGATLIQGGKLALGSSGAINASSGITIDGEGASLITASGTAITAPISVTRGTIGGTGTISAASGIVIAQNAAVAPGASPGSQSYTTGLTFGPGGTYQWEINNATGTMGTNWDVLNVSGFNLTADSATPFTIAVNGLDATNAVGVVPNFVNTSNYAWQILAADAPIADFVISKFTLATTNFATLNDLAGGNFAVARGDAPGVGGTNQQLFLTYTPAPVPEPATLLLLAAGAALLPWRRRRA